MAWFEGWKQKLGLTPPPSQQSHDADESSVDDTKNDMDIDNDNEQSSEGMAISCEVLEYGDGDNSDNDSSHRDGQHLEYLTQPRYDDDDDDSSVLKESSSVDIENNDTQADNHDDSNEEDDEPIPKQRIEKPKQRTTARRRGGRAKRQTGDLLSKLPSTPQSSSSLAALPVATANSQSLAAEKSPISLAVECNGHNKQSPLISTTITSLKPPREANIPKEELYDTNNNDGTYTNTHNDETNMRPQSSPIIPPRKEHPLLHQLTMKQKAIDRSMLHLSDNSYSFVYDESTTSSSAATSSEAAANNTATSNKVTKKSVAAKNQGFISWSPGATTKEKVTTPAAATVTERSNSDQSNKDNNGLPFVGPGLKDQYDTMLKLLRDGLLGTYNDDDDNNNNNNILNLKPKIQSNVSAILMGPRGHGKSLLLERCLAELSRVAGKRKERVLQKMHKLQQQQQQQQLNGHDGIDQVSKVNTELFTQSSFRVVRINGLLYQGDNAVACTREIARQINAMSRMEKNNRSSGSSRRSRKGGTPVKESSSKRQRISNHHDILQTPTKLLSPTEPSSPMMSPKSPIPNNESHQFRLRRSGFNTNISLLDEALRTARIDGIPILIVLEELDTFLAGGKSYNMTAGSEQLSHQEQGGSNDRQLLLYHLLDRVADHKFLVSLVGMTTNLSTINQLEKRVQSRAEGTSKVIYFGHDVDGGYDACVESLLGKFYTPPVLLSNKKLGGSEGRILFDDGAREECMEQTEMMNLRNEVETIFRGSQAGSDEDAD
eukprot:scaffold23435_cov78-Skeletonema_dohrnii-CCMP3373.AAC.1